MKSKALIGGIIALIVIVLAIVFCVWAGSKINQKLSELNPSEPQNSESNVPQPDEPQQVSKGNLPFGNPSNATSNTSNSNNYLLENQFYALSYNREKGIANWVAWSLSKSDFGSANRQNDFRPDDRLPESWTRILPSDYSGSGFDRGHICPSADRSRSVEANSSTFLMSNMSPQTAELNQGPWEKLETYSRSMARRDGTLYIIAGQYGASKKVKNKITVPTNFWKIIVVLPPGADFSAINKDTRVIVVDMPNIKGIKEKNWRDYRTTVRQIEQKTGYNFLSNLPQNVQNSLETKVDDRKSFMQTDN